MSDLLISPKYDPPRDVAPTNKPKEENTPKEEGKPKDPAAKPDAPPGTAAPPPQLPGAAAPKLPGGKPKLPGGKKEGGGGAPPPPKPKKKGGPYSPPEIPPMKGVANANYGGGPPGCPCKAPEGEDLFDPHALAVHNAFVALKYGWEVQPGLCKFVLPPANLAKCGIPLMAPCCCPQCGKKRQIKCAQDCMLATQDKDPAIEAAKKEIEKPPEEPEDDEPPPPKLEMPPPPGAAAPPPQLPGAAAPQLPGVAPPQVPGAAAPPPQMPGGKTKKKCGHNIIGKIVCAIKKAVKAVASHFSFKEKTSKSSRNKQKQENGVTTQHYIRKNKIPSFLEITEQMKTKELPENEKAWRLAYCGFACMSCDYKKVLEGADLPGEIARRTSQGIAADGTSGDIPPAWWYSIMHTYLESVKTNLDGKKTTG